MSVFGIVKYKKSDVHDFNYKVHICLTDVTEIATKDLIAEHVWITISDYMAKQYHPFIYNCTMIGFTGTINEYVLIVSRN